MELTKNFEPTAIETKWYKHWIDKGYFNSTPDEREPYTIVIPPPNVTGVLHMGHMLNNTIQDILIRRARMQGKNACWVPGTDHASIATEAKVVQKLKAEGISKSDLTREQFLAHAFEWKDKHGGIILEQLKRLGASCDWERTHFTMDPEYSESVINVFIDLFQKGKIYRGVRMVNWDPEALTALSDEEVNYKEVNSKLFYVRYQVLGESDQWLTIATTRPETILGDTAICVHPDDARYQKLIGKTVLVPLINREIPVIADEYVDKDFGTGCLKVTPAHDPNDYELGQKHNLPSIDLFNDNGTLNAHGAHYQGKDRFEVRREIEKEHETYIRGFLWTLANNPRVPAAIRQKVSAYGLSKDEFTDNGGWPWMIYIREARRMVTDYVMTQHDCEGKRRAPDPVGLGSFGMDSHVVQHFVTEKGYAISDGVIWRVPPKPYGISYRSIIPRRGECENLLSPICVSATHVAHGSIRMEPVFMALAHSAAIAAGAALDKNTSVQDVAYPLLRERLLAGKQVLQP